jgi:hypothetical protein
MYLEIRPTRRTRVAARLTLALALILALASGCATESNTGVGPGGANSNGASGAAAPPPANTPSTANAPPTTAQPAGLSPTEVVRGYYEAGVRKDVAGARRFLSRATLRMMEEMGRRQGKTLDQLFGEAAEAQAQKPQPGFTNERIMGDKATVDIEAPEQPALTMPLVREDGEWKLVFGRPKGGAAGR